MSKFAVKGFTEGLLADFATHAPHVSVHCVMPGFIATNMAENSTRIALTNARGGERPTEARMDRYKEAFAAFANDPEGLTPEDAAAVILGGVEAGEFAILVGDDAVALDKGVRASEIGSFYPHSSLNDKGVNVDLAKKGDPTYFPGRQTQLAGKAKL